jgi:pimeloyl-ACP methyl ester carboxylesterase
MMPLAWDLSDIIAHLKRSPGENSMRSFFLCGLLLLFIFLSRSAQDASPKLALSTKTSAEDSPKMQAQVAGKGTALVLLGGGSTGAGAWEPHAARLVWNRTVIRLQNLNLQYGIENRPLPPHYSVKTESQAMKASLDDLHLTQPLDLVGWSYGGLIALDFAFDNPDRVRTLSLIEPPAFWAQGRQEENDADIRHMKKLLETLP